MLPISYKKILAVALPMMGSSFVQSIVLMTDSAYLSRYNTEAFAAVGNAGLIYLTLFMFAIGISDGSQIMLSNKIGAKRTDELGSILRNSIFTLLIAIGILFSLLQFFLSDILATFVHNPAILDYQETYLSIRSVGLFAALFYLPIQAYFYAWGKSWVPLVAAILTALTNIVLDYAMIFGKFGFPQMGLSGAAWASNIADFVGAGFLITYLFRSKEHLKNQLFDQFKIVKGEILDLLKIALPIVFQGIVSLSTWTIFFIWLEQKGLFEVTVSQNIRSIYFLAFVPVFGFASATKTYISQYYGAAQIELIPLIQKRIQLLSLVFMLVVFHGGFLYPEKLIYLVNPKEEYLEKSAEILRFVSLSIFLYSFMNVYFHTINGIGRTKITFAIESIGVLIYIFSANLFLNILDWDIKYVWTVEYIYFGCMGIMSFLYLKYSNWKNI